jgi:hypothetical protein
MKRGTKSTREYIKARIPQLMDDMNKATDPYDKQWYNRIIQELTWAYEMQSDNKTNCYMEETHVGAIGGKEIWS